MVRQCRHFFFPRHAQHFVGPLTDGANLATLQGTKKLPLEISKITSCVSLGHELVDVVLTKNSQSRFVARSHHIDVMVLAHRHDGDGFERAPVLNDGRSHRSEIRRDRRRKGTT